MLLAGLFSESDFFKVSKHVVRTLIKMVPAFLAIMSRLSKPHVMFRFTTTKTRLPKHSFGTSKFDVKVYLEV